MSDSIVPTPIDITDRDFADERRPAAQRLHLLVMARCAADPSRTYMQHRDAMRAEVKDRDFPLPEILTTSAQMDERVSRDVAKSGLPYARCYAAVVLQQQEAKLRPALPPARDKKVLPFRKTVGFKSEAEIIGRVREIAAEAKPTTSKPSTVTTNSKPAVKPKPATVVPVPRTIQQKFRQVAAAIVHLGRRAIRGASLTREDYAAQDLIHRERMRRQETHGGPFADFQVASRAVRTLKDGPSRDAAIESMTSAAAEIEALLSKPEGPEAA